MSGDEREKNTVFREVQRFHQWWIYLVVLAVTLFAWYAPLRQLFADRPPGEKEAPDWFMYLVWLLMGMGFPALFLSARLVVEVRDDGIHYRYHPFHLRFHRIGVEEIEEAEARTYRPVLEYGGWGIRYGRKGKAYNVSGNRGVQLRLRDGRRVLFGSQRAEEFASALQEVMASPRRPREGGAPSGGQGAPMR
ncbi:MAG: hypothetical protein H5T73_00610 [Actinobacteria bacterium]|nr:hypothetical protein [Actinomycetota bacterium]